MKAKFVYWLALAAIAAATAAIIILPGPGDSHAPISENGTIRFCFTMQEDCESVIAGMIGASKSAAAALYDVDSEKIRSALEEKGADVLVFEDNYEGYGQKVSSKGLMHDKFYILTGVNGTDYVITGSTNPTANDFRKNDNNVVIISSPTLVGNYRDEFNEIKSGAEGRKTQDTKIIFNGFEIENYFCPEDRCEAQVLEEIGSANESIRFMAFSFTSDVIGSAIAKKAREGVLVRGIFDKSQVSANGKYSEYGKLYKAGIDVAIEQNPGKLHHKVFIIDDRTVITGSYNPTGSGNTRNDENILIIHDNSAAGIFTGEFNRLHPAH